MGDVEDAEDSLPLAGGQAHVCPWLQKDRSGAPCALQEPVQVGNLMACEEGQVQRVARHLQRGVQASGPRDCREAEDGPGAGTCGSPWLSARCSWLLKPIPPHYPPPTPPGNFCFVLSLDESGCCSPA